MNLPWQTRKHRRRLEALREARDAALRAVDDAKARRDTRGHHDALKRAHVATHALMRAENAL